MTTRPPTGSPLPCSPLAVNVRGRLSAISPQKHPRVLKEGEVDGDVVVKPALGGGDEDVVFPFEALRGMTGTTSSIAASSAGGGRRKRGSCQGEEERLVGSRKEGGRT